MIPALMERNTTGRGLRVRRDASCQTAVAAFAFGVARLPWRGFSYGGFAYLWGNNPGTESAGINRHIVGDERALRKRRSDSILASSLACDPVRSHSEA